ncbi:unnamed protein product [Calypogeia fissa]
MADLVKLEKVGRVYILTMLGEGEHRLNEPMFEAIILALETVHKAEDAAALVTTNEGRFYSNGLDMNWVKAQQFGKGVQSRYNLNTVLATLVNMNVPTIAAICGHASAAGFIMALAHDHRCMRSDRGFLYMSEIDVQVRIPLGTMSLIRSSMSPKAFKDTVLLARKQTANEAYGAGIVDSVHQNSAETLKAAIAWATQLSKRGFSREFYRTMRLDMNPSVLQELVSGSTGTHLYPKHPILSKL